MLKQRDKESNFDYHSRLIYGKLVDKTMLDNDYTELSSLVYGKEYSSDVARRMMYGSLRTLKLLENEEEQSISDSSILKELDLKKIELEKERQKFFDQRREYKKLIRSDARFEYVADKLADAANRLNVKNPLDFQRFSYDIDYDDSEGLIVFSDWHYGQVSDNIWNTYNIEICKRRVEKFIAKSIEYLKRHKPYQLHVVLLGDLANGSIHVGSRVESEEDTCDQLMQVSEIVAQAIAELSKYVDDTIVYSTYGNHMRTIQNKKDSKYSDNMEKIIPWWLKQRLSQNSNITIVDSEYYEFIKLNICGYNIVCSHGDLDRVKDFGVTVNALFTKKFNDQIHYTILADKHHIEEFEQLGIENILVRSLCGTDSYANNYRLYSAAGQTLMFFTKEDGRECTYNIKLD